MYSNKKKTPQKKQQLNKFIRLSGIGLQLGITIYLAAYFGKKLDAHYQNDKKVFTLVFIMIAFVGTLISLMVQLKKIQEKDKNE